MQMSRLPVLWASLLYLRGVTTLVPVYVPWRNKLPLSCAAIFAHRRDDEEAPSRSGRSLKLISLDVNQNQVHEILRNLNHKVWNEALNGFGESFLDGDLVLKTHLTLAFCRDFETQMALLDTFKSLQGCQVKLSVISLLWNDQVAALQVHVAEETLLDGQYLVVPRTENQFPHITVWVGTNASAYLSNQLPGDPKTQRIDLTSQTPPVTLTGVLSFWDQENEPLRIID